jgi:GTPase SAR1 family protein
MTPALLNVVTRARGVIPAKYVRLIVKLDAIANDVRGQRFEVAVVGLMKNGKSTLLNNLVEAYLFPEGVLPETSATVSTRHDPSATEVTLRVSPHEVVRGAPAVRQRLADINNRLRQLPPDDNSIPRQYEMTMKLPLLENNRHNNQRALQLSIHDTPGVNEDSVLISEITAAVLTSVSVIVFVMDITKLASTDEFAYLTQITASRPDLVPDGRCVVFLNKLAMRSTRSPHAGV